MQTTQPKYKLTVKSTKFELHQSSTNEVKQDNTVTFDEYQPSFVTEKPKIKLAVKPKPKPKEIETLSTCSVSTGNPSPQNSLALNEKAEEKVIPQPNSEELTSEGIKESQCLKVHESPEAETAITTRHENLEQQNQNEEIGNKEEHSRVYSKEFVLNIIREAQSAVPLPEFEFLTNRTKIEVQATLKPNYQQKVAQRPVFLKSNIGKNSTQKEQPEQNLTLNRNTTKLAAKPAADENSGIIQRQAITKEELETRARIEKNLNKWEKNIKSNKTPKELLQNSIRLQLNILTPDNYEKIKEEIKSLAAQSKFATESVCDILIEKAWNEVKYCKLYANLCEYLGKIESLCFDNAGKSYFKSYLIGKIQGVFEDEGQLKIKAAKSLDEMTTEEKELYYSKRKKRILGNVTFIGELIAMKFLATKVVIYCTRILLAKYFAGLAEATNTPSASSESNAASHEDHIEGLIQLYVIVGKTFEERNCTSEAAKIYSEIENACTKALKGDKNFSINAAFSMDQIFTGFRVLANMAPLTPRIRVLIQNLEDLRKKKWETPEFMNQKPKTLKEIHQEIEEEEGDRNIQSFNKKAPQTMSYVPKNTHLAQPSKMTDEECMDGLKKAYKSIEKNEEEPESSHVESLQKSVLNKCKNSDFVKAFMSTFSDGRKSAIQRRISLLQLCFQKSLVSADGFSKGFGEALYDLWMEASDFPGIEENYARILLMAETMLKGFSIADLYIPSDLKKNTDKECIVPTYLDVLNSAIDLTDSGQTKTKKALKALIKKLESI